MIDEKLLKGVMHQYFIDALHKSIKKNKYTSNLLQKMVDDGLTEEEACDIMIYAYLSREVKE